MNVTYNGENKMCLHKQIGEGTTPNGRKCRLIQTNYGISMQVYNEGENNGWKSYGVSYMDLSKAIMSEIQKIESGEKE